MSAPERGPASVPKALQGVRVLDLSRVWAGPHAGRLLADFGAEVIHITSRRLVGDPTVSRETARMLAVFPDDEPGPRPWNRNSQTIDLARNKLDITLELNTPQGLDLFQRLVKISHVVLENYSPRVMPNFGLDYAALRALNPAIIKCSMPGYGSTGPFRDYVSYGTNVDPASGLASLMGYPGEGPHLGATAYPDPVAALHAVGAILAALIQQRRTGQGQEFDLSQCEATTSVIGEAVLGYQLTGRVPPRVGNRHPCKAPQGCYPCLGADRWVVISIGSDAEWQAFSQVLGDPPWSRDEALSTAPGRWAAHDALDAHIAQWMRGFPSREVMQRLQTVGIACGQVVDAEELVNDPHLAERGFYWEIDHPEAGMHRHAGQPIRLSGTPARLFRPAPLLGQHNRQVLGGLLGLSPQEIDELERQGVIGDRPIAPSA